MVWSAISFEKRYPLVTIDVTKEKFNGERYLNEIIKPHLAKHLNSLRNHGQRHTGAVEDASPIHFKQSIIKEKEKMGKKKTFNIR